MKMCGARRSTARYCTLAPNSALDLVHGFRSHRVLQPSVQLRTLVQQVLGEEQHAPSFRLADNVVAASSATTDERCAAAMLQRHVVQVDLHRYFRNRAVLCVAFRPCVGPIHVRGKVLPRRVAQEAAPFVQINKLLRTPRERFRQVRREDFEQPASQLCIVNNDPVPVADASNQLLAAAPPG